MTVPDPDDCTRVLFQILMTVHTCCFRSWMTVPDPDDCTHVLFQILDDYVHMGLFPKCLLSEGMHYNPPDNDDDQDDQ